jgi:hypothetical protein
VKGDVWEKNGWSYCYRCECVYPQRELDEGTKKDVILNLVSTVYSCKDEKRCAEYKAHRAAAVGVKARIATGIDIAEKKEAAGVLKAPRSTPLQRPRKR